MRGAHKLECMKGGTYQDLEMERKQACKGQELTNWRVQREGLVRTQKDSKFSRGTHFLESAERGACQDME